MEEVAPESFEEQLARFHDWLGETPPTIYEYEVLLNQYIKEKGSGGEPESL